MSPVSHDGIAPVANAGTPQSVVAGSVVTLDASASSDANGDALTYLWTLTAKPMGSTAALSSNTSAKPVFTADAAGTYVASLTVSDGKLVSDVKTVSINAANILYQWNFEGLNPLNNLIQENSGGITIVQDPNNPNNKVLKTTILKGGDRTELSLATEGNLLYYYADAKPGFSNKTELFSRSLGNEFWMSLKILKPQEQNTNGIKPSIVQIGPVSNINLYPALGSAGFWQLRVRNGTTLDGDTWNSRLFGDNTYTPLPNSEANFVKKSYGLWEKFIIHFKYSTDAGGVVEVWKDGVKYVNLTGQNAREFNRARIKFGLYLGVGNSAGQDLTCYFDDIKICGSDCSYELLNK